MNYALSIITVCYNSLPALQRTAASVWQQDCTDYEYLIVDGASTDGTLPWLQACDSRITKWVSEPDKGIYDAMNKGVSMAKGQWVIFLNAGDVLYAHDTLSSVKPYLTANDAQMVYGDITKKKNGVPVRKNAEEPHNAHRMFFCHQSLFCRREVLLRFPFDLSHPLSADFKMVKTAYKAGITMRHIPVIVADFDTTGVSNTQVNKGLKDNIRVIRELDSWWDRLRFIPRLQFRIFWKSLKG